MHFVKTPCWIWEGSRSSTGYGNFMTAEQECRNGHKAIYELVRGKVPDGLQLDHLCRNRACVNPWHLEIVTNYENAQRGMRASAVRCCRGHLYTKWSFLWRISKLGTLHRRCLLCQKIYEKYRTHRRRQNAIHTASAA